MREGGSESGGREGRLRKGKSEEWMDGAKERGQGGSERREQRSEGEEKGRSVGGREIGREGKFKGGTLRRTLASIHAQNNTQRGPCHCDFGITGIVMRRNVLFDTWMS